LLYLGLQLGKENYVADALLPEEHHAEAVNTHPHATRWWHPVFQSDEEILVELLLLASGLVFKPFSLFERVVLLGVSGRNFLPVDAAFKDFDGRRIFRRKFRQRDEFFGRVRDERRVDESRFDQLFEHDVQFFNRQFPDLEVFRKQFRPVLETIAAAQEPLNMQYLRALFSWSAYDEGELECNFGSLFPVSEGRIQPFHLSALEWLCDKSKALRYFVSVQEGHRCLAAHGWKQIVDAYGLEGGLSGGVPEPEISNLQDAYDLRYLTAHLEGADRVQDLHRLLRFERTVGEQRQNLWYAVKASNGQLNGYMNDLERAWRQAKITNDVGLQVRYALCLSSVSHVGNIPSPTLELALKYEVLTWQQAIDFAQLQRELSERAKALCRLAPFLPDGERAPALTDALILLVQTNMPTS